MAQLALEMMMVKARFPNIYGLCSLRRYMPFLFICGLVVAHSIAEYTTVCALMIYLLYVIEKHLFMAAITVNVSDGLSGLLAFLIAHVADAYTDCFSVTVFSTASYIMGLILLWIANCSDPSEQNLLNVAVLLIALGKSGGGSPLRSFFENQLSKERNQTRTETMRKRGLSEEGRMKSAWHILRMCGYSMAIMIFVFVRGNSVLKFYPPFSFNYAIDHHLRMSSIISSISMILGSLPFFYGNRFYHYESPSKTSLSHVLKELKVALSSKLHLWAVFIPYGVVLATGNTLFIAQITNMNVNFTTNVLVIIPILFVLKSFTSDIVNILFWWRDSTKKRATTIRIGAGMICSVICCIVARQVELSRLHLMKKEGLIESQNPLKRSSMSVLWLVPVFFMLGLTEGLVGGGLVKHIYGNLSESMKGYAEPLSELVVCVGKFCSIVFMSLCKFWFGQSINMSKLDRYFVVLAVLCFVSFCFYSCSWRNFDDGSAYKNIVESNQEELSDESMEEIGKENMETQETLINAADIQKNMLLRRSLNREGSIAKKLCRTLTM